MIVVLVMFAAAILVGGGLFAFGPSALREPVAFEGEASALSADVASDVPFAVIAEGNAESVTERKNYAAYTEEDFERLWVMAYGEEAEEMPPVDFDEEYVIGVFAGEKPSGGHGIRVESITDEDALRKIAIAIERPEESCATTAAVTSPFQIVTAPFTDRELARAETEVTVACE